MKKKIISLLLIAAMALTLCACGTPSEARLEKLYARAYSSYFTEHDYDAAFKLLKGTEQYGYAPMLWLLGVCYEDRHGTERSYDEAFRLYSAAAEQGDPLAMVDLAYCYIASKGTEYDRDKADELFEQSVPLLQAVVESDDAPADIAAYYRYLGSRYYNAQGVARDYDKAFELYMKAAELGDAATANRVGEC